MRSQAQITIYSLNDVVTSATAPASPYLGQLWVDTSKTPPVTMVWNGSAWEEQNGTATIRSTIKTIEEKEASLESNLNGLTSTVSSVTKRVELVESDLGEAQETILDIQTDISELEQTASSIALRVSANEEDISELVVTASGLTTRVTSAEGSITSLKTSVSGLTTRVSSAEGDISTIEQNVSSITTRVVSAEGSITTLKTSVSGLTTRVSNTEGEVSSLEQSVSSITTRITNAEGDISDLTTDLSSITARVKTAEGNITSLSATVSGISTRVTAAEGNISSLEQNVSSITTQVATNRGNISTLSQTVDTISTKVETNRGNISTLTQTVDSVEIQLETNRGNISTLTTSVSGIATRVTNAEGDISSIEQNLSSVTTRVSTAEGNITTLTTSVNGIKTRMTTAEGNISALEQDLDSITTRVSTAEGDISTIEQNVTSVTTRISSAEGNITTLTTGLNSVKTRMTTAEGDISTLEQTTSELSAKVTTKVDEEGGSTESFGWKLTSDGFYLYSGYSTVMSVTSAGLALSGTITATGGTIGGFTIGSTAIYKTKTSYNSSTAGVYLGTDGIGLGTGKFYVTSAGYLYSTSGSIGGFTISTSAIYKTKTSYSSSTAGVYLGTTGIGLGAGTFYVSSAGYLYSTSGKIGGFSISSSYISLTKITYSDSNEGVYLGTAGIGLGAGTFYVTAAGYLYATNANITGTITATSGSISELTVDGYLYFGNNSSYYINANYNDTSYYIYLPGFRVDDASGAVFSGKLSAPSGTIGGFTISTSAIYKTKTSYSSTTAGVYIGTTGIGLGAGTFYVTSAGYLYATNASITGTINATSGYFENCEIGESCYIYGYVYCYGAEEIKFYGSKRSVTYDTYIGGYGIASEIASTISGTTYYSYSYVRPLGMILVPNSYSTYANDGMIFGVMQAYNYKTENLLAGVSFYYGNDGTYLTSECLFRCCDCTIIDAIYSSGYGEVYWGNINFTNYLSSDWYVSGSSGYISSVYVSSTTYAALYGIWYIYSSLRFGTSTSSYQLYIDKDQVTFRYNNSQIGDIECYSTYVDFQGTFKTNGNSWISSSDRKAKNHIDAFSNAYSVLFDNLKPRIYRYNVGTSGRYHSGFVVQDVLEAMKVAGLTTQDFAAVCALGDPNDEDTEWGLRYEELISLNTWEIQKLKARVAELEKILSEKENKK